MSQNQERKTVSTPHIMPTYIGVLSTAIAKAMNTSAQAHADIKHHAKYRARVIALWNILPPEVRSAVREKLGIKHPDDYVKEIRARQARKAWAWLVERHGCTKIAYCLDMDRGEIARRLKKLGVEPKDRPFSYPHFLLKEDACSDFRKDRREADRQLVSAKIWALDKVLRTIIDELHRHGWLAKEETVQYSRLS